MSAGLTNEQKENVLSLYKKLGPLSNRVVAVKLGLTKSFVDEVVYNYNIEEQIKGELPK